MSNKKRGKLVVIEGGVGCGKTTQIKLLKKNLKNWEFYRYPGSTEYGEKVRDAIQGIYNYKVNEYAAAFGYASTMANLMMNLIIPKLKKGKNIVMDRYWYTMYAYQSVGGVSKKLIQNINKIVTDDTKPDLVIFYDLDPKIGMRRKDGKKDSDKYDIKKVDFHKKVRRNYHEMGKKMGKRWVTIDASKSVEEIQKETSEILKNIV